MRPGVVALSLVLAAVVLRAQDPHSCCAWGPTPTRLALAGAASRRFPPAARAGRRRSDQQPPRPTFRAGTNLVRVDATVTDGQGRPVLDLTQNDFEVSENGKLQAIESFKLVQLSGEQDPGDEESLPIRSPEHGRVEAARDEVRLFAIFFDDYHVNQQIETFRAQELLVEFVKSLGPRDLVTLMDPLTPLDALRFSRDRHELSRLIRLFTGRRGIYMPPRSAAEEEQLARARNIERVRSEVTMSALKALVTHLGSLRESRKTVVFLSGGFRVGGDMWTELSDLFQAASQSNTAIYPVDPGFLGGRSSVALDVLRTLADNTGGRAIVNVNRFDQAMAQVVRDASAYYLIGYVSSNPAPDGRFREIKVRVTRRGAEVHARRGYWALTAAEASAQTVTPAPPPELARAFASLAASRGGRPIDAFVSVLRGAADRMRVDFTWAARPVRDASAGAAPALVKLTVFDPDGRERFQGDVPAAPADPLRPAEPSGSVTFELPAGPAKLKIEAVDRRGDAVDVEVRDVSIPDLWTPPVVIATPRVIRARDGRQFQAVMADPNAAGSPGREFRRTDRLLIRFALYANAPSPTVAARLVTRTGDTLVTLPVAAATAPSTHQIDLPLGNLAAGDYLLRIEAKSADASTTELIPLRVQ